MNYQDLSISRSYISYGDSNIASSLIEPALKMTKYYKRSVGYFSSSVFSTIFSGISSLINNNGRMMLITSPILSEKDIEAINLGYELKENVLSKIVDQELEDSIRKFKTSELELLVELISKSILDIKIAVTNNSGQYHDKLGILEDFSGNKIVYYGSANESYNGYHDNYEKIRVVKSWIPSERPSVEEEIKEFDSLWYGSNPYVSVYEYKDSARNKILQVIKNLPKETPRNEGITLRDYQLEAIMKWKNNNYHGFYVMATGTGKTWTAIYSAKELLKIESCLIVICAPYKHLVKQWAEDIYTSFPTGKVILVSSENNKWEAQINEEILRSRYKADNQIIIISTISSFNMERFDHALSKSNAKKLLIVDEAHRFTKRSITVQARYDYMLGLSATPHSGRSTEKGEELMNFFGGRVFNLPIETALDKGFLVPYFYNPIYISATEEEEEKFKYFSLRMASCFKNGILVDRESLAKHYRNRLRVISMAQEKIDRIDEILGAIKENSHFIVYCGDGRLFDNDYNKELRHIQFVKKALDKHGYKPSQFTSTENMNKRIELVEAFNNEEISALAAIRCLDEGINIPSIHGALILSSNDDYREFVQRRGRILRTYKTKKNANIYDVIVLPSTDCIGMAIIELRRFYEYAKLSINKSNLLEELDIHLENYKLVIDDILANAEEIMEDNENE